VLALQNGAKLVIINLEATPVDSKATLVIHDDVAAVLPEVVHRLEVRRL
jgi:NAD-dependent SIR2 family protein deacetylase